MNLLFSKEFVCIILRLIKAAPWSTILSCLTIISCKAQTAFSPHQPHLKKFIFLAVKATCLRIGLSNNTPYSTQAEKFSEQGRKENGNGKKNLPLFCNIARLIINSPAKNMETLISCHLPMRCIQGRHHLLWALFSPKNSCFDATLLSVAALILHQGFTNKHCHYQLNNVPAHTDNKCLGHLLPYYLTANLILR